MTQVTIDLDEETAKALACAAERDHVSESAWATEAVRKRLDTEDPVGPDDDIMKYYGAWDDDRTAEEIIADIKSYPPQRERVSLD